MLGCFKLTLGQKWTNTNIGLKIKLKKKIDQTFGFCIFILTQLWVKNRQTHFCCWVWVKYGQTQMFG